MFELNLIIQHGYYNPYIYFLIISYVIYVVTTWIKNKIPSKIIIEYDINVIYIPYGIYIIFVKIMFLFLI